MSKFEPKGGQAHAIDVTDEMVRAGWNYLDPYLDDFRGDPKELMTKIYRAMVSASLDIQGAQLVFAADRLLGAVDKVTSRGLTGDRLKVTVGPYLGPALPTLDDGCVGFLVEKRDGCLTFLAFE